MAIEEVLRATGCKACLVKANLLIAEESSCHSLHLRNLYLTPNESRTIAELLKKADEEELKGLKSISISNNPALGNDGVISFIEVLPSSIQEIGMVNCGMSDVAGRRLLDWMEETSYLQMVCIEDNDFSSELRSSFTAFANSSPNLLLVI